jgi:hypothetical protein
MPRQSPLWTEDDEMQLLGLQQQGVSLNRMSVRLGRSKRAIEVRLSSLRRRQPGHSQFDQQNTYLAKTGADKSTKTSRD